MKERVNLSSIKYEENCAKLIVSGLVHYYFSKRVQDLRVDFKIKEKSLRVIAEGVVKIEPKDLQELDRISNSRRIPEFDNYYDTLVGIGNSASDSSNIDTLGSMVDEAIVSYGKNGLLTILLVRNF
ncbi:hypothetical protein HMPREF3188_00898 [Tissierellia bacterium KA00581]|jgi:hypothetical protein|nr:hypothetical protein HMPREF3188_00898 [Tissierellia bacterium KA00581]